MTEPRPSQRDRVIEAMIATAARYGYREASVARVIAQAGVSRATFYEHFGDKETCFLAAYREVAARVLREVQLVEEKLRAAGSPREILARLLESADRDPDAARFILIESLAGTPAVRAEHQRLLDTAETALQRHLDGRAPDAPLAIPARALLGGLAGVVAIRAFRGDAGRLGELADDLGAWIDSYSLAAGVDPLGEGGWAELGTGFSGAEPDSLGEDVLSRRLPRGRGALPLSVVTSEQRQRVLAAVARLSREKGYAEMTVGDVVATAGVTREAFYAQFRGKRDAFLAVQAFGLEKSVSLTAGAFFGRQGWRDRVWSGLEAMLSYVAGQRDLVFVDFVESYAAGPAALRRSFENRMAYTLFLEDGYRQRPEAEELPRLCSEAIAGAIYELIRRQVMAGGTERMLEILPQVAYVALAPFVGSEAAFKLIEEKSGRPIPRSVARLGEG